MAQFVKQSTVTIVRVGPFVDVGDGFTPETGVTVAASDEAEVLKAAGAATVSMAGTFAAISGADGWYDYTLSATDTDVVGDLTLIMNDDDVHLPVACRFQVIEEEVFDDIFATSGVGYLKPVVAGNDVDVAATGEVGVDFGNILGTLDAADIGTNAIGSAQFAQAAADKVFGSSGATLAELSQALPPATPRPDQALMLLYMALRNKLDTTSTLLEVHNDAGTVIAQATLSDDGTTFTRAEMVAGV